MCCAAKRRSLRTGVAGINNEIPASYCKVAALDLSRRTCPCSHPRLRLYSYLRPYLQYLAGMLLLMPATTLHLGLLSLLCHVVGERSYAVMHDPSSLNIRK